MDEIRFTVAGEPASKSRARFTKRGSKVHAFTPEKTKEAEQRVAAAYLAIARRLNKNDESTAFAVEADFYLAKMQRRDVDNMLKLVLDGLNQVAWADDAQVVDVQARKHLGAPTGLTEVVVRSLGPILRPDEVACARCGSMFRRPPSHNKKIYCGGECRSAALREARQRSCKGCGEPMVSRHGSAFCSPACHYESKNIPATCVNCGADFSKPRHLNRSGNSYCSPECKATYWRNHRKSAAQGTCDDCGGPTTKKTYKRCQDCHFAAGGRWADRTGETT